ncbi:uncharacterized protein RCC_02525 [Ramularia collo-cygni]|uniref:C2 NT-type domain-containing protein n=1 Tax=Ramularia collo-cygni TaxID=112498 RepID=A0A2D3UUP2_9PEZI|nr:uncharacterized protein RCC_02525 [Ramularia collo-cygni]CZT16690.1 uncharacterized protein RCC_02525 [Ramularia collo-cygni]
MAFVSKSRKVRFSLNLKIHDLNNVPLVSGTSFIKWHLPASTAAEHRGRTAKSPIKDHRVVYDYEKSTTLRLTVSKSGQLQECNIAFEVQQEYSAGGRGERITLGHVTLNLAEYVNASMEPASPGKDGEEGITRRYLMQESKINSTLKIGIKMQYLEGTRDFHAPALRSAPVFGGIAGIISSSDPVNVGTIQQRDEALARGVGDGEDAAAIPNLSMSTNGKEVGEMQDMYRKTLSAFWSSQPGELKADECIEDIFAGGDGWGKGGRPGAINTAAANQQSGSHPGSGASTPNNPEDNLNISTRGEAGRGSSSIGPMLHRHDFSASRHGHHHHHNKAQRKMAGAEELDEMDVRDDLRGWRIGEAAHS